MKDEIKEILEDIKEIYYFKPLLDYITNLQEENERLKELCDKYEEEHNTAFKLWTTKMEKIPTYEEKKELQDRIDNAIELLNDWNYLDKIDCYYEPKEVIDILKGE